nr:hypothetical protein [Rhodococcus wratislaviensis]
MEVYNSDNNAARCGGRLLALVGDRDVGTLADEVCQLTGEGRFRFDDVLDWLVTTIADVVIARLGVTDAVDSFVGRAAHCARPARSRAGTVAVFGSVAASIRC